MEQPFQIARLLYKKIKGNLSSEEEKQLQQWIDESEKNQAFYDDLSDDHRLIEKLDNYELFDKPAAWKSLDKKLFDAKVIGLNTRKLLKYAAVMIPFVLLLGGSYYWWKQQVYSYASIDETIKPLGQKATLQLANGKILNLQNENNTAMEEGEAQLRNQNDLLSYVANKEIKSSAPLVYNTLLTPKGGRYQLTLSDGTAVWLNANTSIRYPVVFSDTTREVFLEGEAYFDVQHNGKAFIVNTEEANIRVLGTSFNVSAYANEPHASTTLVEGSVKLITSEAEQLLEPNEQGNVFKHKTDIEVQAVDTDLYTSWMRGKVEFEDESLEAVMRRLARLYNFQYEFDNEAAKNYHFTARIENTMPISDILKMLEMTTKVEFDLEENTLIIH